MSLWTIASVIVLVLAAVTVALLVREGRMPGDWGVRRVTGPDWLLPSPREVREPSFDLVWQGYDPRQVDAYLDAVAAAYEELLLASGPSVAARVERRLADRAGRRLDELPESARDATEDPGRDQVT